MECIYISSSCPKLTKVHLGLKSIEVNTVQNVLECTALDGGFGMVLECTVVNGSSDGIEKYGRAFIHQLAVSCHLLDADHHVRNHWCQEPGLGDTVMMSSAMSWLLCWVWWVSLYCLPGRFSSCPEFVGSTGGILKSAYNLFPGATVSGVFKVAVGGISGSVQGAYGRLTIS